MDKGYAIRIMQHAAENSGGKICNGLIIGDEDDGCPYILSIVRHEDTVGINATGIDGTTISFQLDADDFVDLAARGMDQDLQ